jgi:hypothetical protein
VRIAFAIDTHDREIITWVATPPSQGNQRRKL